jgi:hypothetical protein
MKPGNLAFSAIALLLLATPVVAQQHHGHKSPYSDMQQRPVKALSDEQLADLRAGRGMGLALPGELNGYPGPSHVLELADELQLTLEQRRRVQDLFNEMKVEAIAVGEKLIAQETALDRAFADRNISPESLLSRTAQIGETQGQLRAVHLKYHLTTADLLTEHQRHRYAELRGYR